MDVSVSISVSIDNESSGSVGIGVNVSNHMGLFVSASVSPEISSLPRGCCPPTLFYPLQANQVTIVQLP